MVVQVEDFGEARRGLVGAAVEAEEELGHRGLPASGHLGCREIGLRGCVIVGFVITEQAAAVAEEERIVAATGCGDLRQHLGPDRAVACDVLVDAVGGDLQFERDAGHVTRL